MQPETRPDVAQDAGFTSAPSPPSTDPRMGGLGPDPAPALRGAGLWEKLQGQVCAETPSSAGEPPTLGRHASQPPLLPEDGNMRSRLMGRREACSGQREQRVGRPRGRASAVSGQQRRGLPEPCSGRRTVLLAGLPAPPAQGPVALHTDHGVSGGRSPWLLLSPPGSLLLPPPLPAISAGHRAPSHLPGLPRPALSSLPRPSPCASHACLLSGPGALRPCSLREALVPGSFCPEGSSPTSPCLLPCPLPGLSGSPGAPHQPFCSRSPGP